MPILSPTTTTPNKLGYRRTLKSQLLLLETVERRPRKRRRSHSNQGAGLLLGSAPQSVSAASFGPPHPVQHSHKDDPFTSLITMEADPSLLGFHWSPVPSSALVAFFEGCWVWITQSSSGEWGPRTDVEGKKHMYEFSSFPYSHLGNKHRVAFVPPASAVDAIGCLLKVPILAKYNSACLQGPPDSARAMLAGQGRCPWSRVDMNLDRLWEQEINQDLSKSTPAIIPIPVIPVSPDLCQWTNDLVTGYKQLSRDTFEDIPRDISVTLDACAHANLATVRPALDRAVAVRISLRREALKKLPEDVKQSSKLAEAKRQRHLCFGDPEEELEK
ncbi:hypothetical protein E2C01_034702 [Portunus trituberculatus]|uniref:Uncharacterized protein n=1 Tax=Portunus trituberculatus TaxID=210409 RepID=A0A5B7F719_PORTR|nr:hypothetical protein [Portunus trituberculatus]